MKGGGEYSLRGTRGLAERKGLKRERKREVDVMKWDKEEKKRNMIGKQTGKQAEWKTQPAFSLVPRFMSMCCVFILAGDRFQQCLSWDQMPREMWGGGQSSGHTRPGRNLSVSEIPDSHTEPCLFVCFSIFILCSSSQQHPFLLSPAKSWDIPSSLFTRSLSLSVAHQWFLFLQTLHVAFSYFVFLAESDKRTDCVS